MSLTIGLICLLLAIGFVLSALKGKARGKSNHVAVMPMLAVLAFMSFMASIAFLMGGSISRVSVSVYGDDADRARYQQLASSANQRYRFYVFNKGERGVTRPTAYSCNEGALNAFRDSVQASSELEIDVAADQHCSDQSVLSSFFKPHINLYFR